MRHSDCPCKTAQTSTPQDPPKRATLEIRQNKHQRLRHPQTTKTTPRPLHDPPKRAPSEIYEKKDTSDPLKRRPILSSLSTHPPLSPRRAPERPPLKTAQTSTPQDPPKRATPEIRAKQAPLLLSPQDAPEPPAFKTTRTSTLQDPPKRATPKIRQNKHP